MGIQCVNCRQVISSESFPDLLSGIAAVIQYVMATGIPETLWFSVDGAAAPQKVTANRKITHGYDVTWISLSGHGSCADNDLLKDNGGALSLLG